MSAEAKEQKSISLFYVYSSSAPEILTGIVCWRKFEKARDLIWPSMEMIYVQFPFHPSLQPPAGQVQVLKILTIKHRERFDKKILERKTDQQ